MPNPAKGPRLYLKRSGRRAVWIIRDGARRVATGCAEGDLAGAQRALARHIAESYAPPRAQRGLDAIPLEDVLTMYLRDRIADHPDRARIVKRFARLAAFWTGRTLAEVTGATCRAYVAARGSNGGARRDLQDLAAAIGHHHREGAHREAVKVWLPPRGKPRDAWLDRSEIAALVWTCWRMRERQEGDTTAKRTMQHVARFILLAYYTASRPGAVLTASWHAAAGRSWLDLEEGVFYRRQEGARETNKRQPPVRLPPRLLAHLRRWRDRGICRSFVVEWHARPVRSVKVAFGRAVQAAGLGAGISPHTLRHSAVTAMMQAGVSPWEAAGLAGMSEAMVRQVYGHHHPDHMGQASAALGGRLRAGSPQRNANKRGPDDAKAH